MIQGGMSQPLFDGMFQPSIFEHDLKRFLTLQQTADGGSFSSFGSKNICCRNGKQTSYTQVEDFSHSWASVTPLSNPRPWPCQNDGSLHGLLDQSDNLQMIAAHALVNVDEMFLCRAFFFLDLQIGAVIGLRQKNLREFISNRGGSRTFHFLFGTNGLHDSSSNPSPKETSSASFHRSRCLQLLFSQE